MERPMPHRLPFILLMAAAVVAALWFMVTHSLWWTP
jgi:hypothetical protein